MPKFLYSWRFYTYGREQYSECMNKVFSNNLVILHQANKILAIIAAVCSVIPVIFEGDFIEGGIFLLVALIAAIISFYSNYLMQQINVNNRKIYFLISLYFANVMCYGIFLDVWSHPEYIAAIFPCFLVCALLMVVISPQFTTGLTLCAMALFIASSIIAVPAIHLPYYIFNSVIAAFLGLFFAWQITKLRLGLEISTTMLEDEKNKYLDQSTVDELTQLKNRRDFMNTFQRYISNYRSSDDWLCIAIADIDFFKLYNDHYGHPQGDECLRSIGAALNRLRDDMNVYTARVGGEEFAILWFEKDASHVGAVIKHWNKIIKELKIVHEKSKVNDYVTMSIGVYIARCGSTNDTQYLYDHADKALYSAKGSGRNCAVITGDEIKEYKITPSSG